MTLICDGCGAGETAGDITHDQDVVWPLLAALGWSGSPFATGSHHCPPCSVEPPQPPPPVRSVPRLHGAAYELHVHTDVDAIVIAPLTDVDIESATALKQVLDQVTTTHQRVLLDLRAAEIIDSTGLGVLVRARQDARQRGGTLGLAAPSRYVLTVLHTMRLDGVFDVFDDRATALHAYRQP